MFKAWLVGALAAGGGWLAVHKPPAAAFHAYCADHELVPFNEYFSTASSACARRSTTAGLAALLPYDVAQPYTIDDLLVATLVTLGDGRRFVGCVGAWREVPGGLLGAPVAVADVAADLVRICLALAALGVLGGLAFSLIRVAQRVFGLMVKATTGAVGLWGALVFIERQADTSRAASYVALALGGAGALLRYRASRATGAARAAAKDRENAILSERDRAYVDAVLAPPVVVVPAAATPAKEVATPARKVTPAASGKRPEVPPAE